MLTSYRFIDLFRALAAFWVVVAHCFIWSGWLPKAVPNAKIAVDLFMMISGFLMAANAEARAPREPLELPSNWRRFWIRRFFRLAPLYYLSLALVVLSSTYYLAGFSHLQTLNPSRWPDGGIYDPATMAIDAWNVLLHVTFLFGLSPSYSFSTFLPDWSLSLEMQFYLAFPCLFLLLRRAGLVRTGLALSVLCFTVGVVIQEQLRFDEPSLLIFKLNYFIAGILIHRFLSTPGWTPQHVALMAGAFGCACIDYRYADELWLLPLLVASMLLLGWWETRRRTPGPVARLTNNAIVKFGSDTSYGVYIFHSFFISAAGWVLHSTPVIRGWSAPERVLAMFAFVSVGAYLFAYLLHRVFEQPCIEFGKRMVGKMPAAEPKAARSEHLV